MPPAGIDCGTPFSASTSLTLRCFSLPGYCRLLSVFKSIPPEITGSLRYLGRWETSRQVHHHLRLLYIKRKVFCNVDGYLVDVYTHVVCLYVGMYICMCVSWGNVLANIKDWMRVYICEDQSGCYQDITRITSAICHSALPHMSPL